MTNSVISRTPEKEKFLASSFELSGNEIPKSKKSVDPLAVEAGLETLESHEVSTLAVREKKKAEQVETVGGTQKKLDAVKSGENVELLHPVVKVALAAVAIGVTIWGIKKITEWVAQEGGEALKNLTNWKGLTLAGILGTSGLAFWKREEITKYIKDKTGITGISEETIELFKKGEFKKGWEELHKNIEVSPEVKAVAEKTGLDAKTIELIKNQKYSDFVNSESGMMAGLLGSATNFMSGDKKQEMHFSGAKEKAVRKYLQENKPTNFKEDATVLEALEKSVMQNPVAVVGSSASGSAQEKQRLNKYTVEEKEVIKRLDLVDAQLYRWIIGYEKTGSPKITVPDVSELRAKLEQNPPQISHKERLGLFADLCVHDAGEIIGKIGFSLATFGGYLAYKTYTEDLPELGRAFFKRLFQPESGDNWELAKAYFGPGIYFAGVATIADVYKNILSGTKHNSLLGSFLRSGPKAMASWPIYSVRLAGKAVSGAAGFLSKPVLLGRFEKVGNALKLIDKAGKILWEKPWKEIFLSQTSKNIVKKTGKKTAELAKTVLESKSLTALKTKLAQKCGSEATKKFFTEALTKIGWNRVKGMLVKRGAVAGASALTGVGTVVSVGLTAWTIYDLGKMGIDFYKNYANKNKLTERGKLAIKKMDFDPDTQKALGHVATGQSVEEVQLLPEFDKLAKATLFIEREGMSGREKWTFEKGQVTNVELENA